MATLRTRTVKSSGGDYSSLAAWEAGEQTDLIVADEIRRAECYNFADTTAVSISGWTTSATQYIEIVAAAGNRHAGVWTTSGYRLIASVTSTPIINTKEDYIRIDGLQIENTGAKSAHPLGIQSGSIIVGLLSEHRITNCIIRATGTGTPGDFCIGVYDEVPPDKIVVANNIVYGFKHGVYFGFVDDLNARDRVSYNNTIISNTGYGLRYEGNGHNYYLRNNLNNGNGTDYSAQGSNTVASSTNVSEDATSPTVALRNLAATFVDEAGGNYHLAAGDTAAKGAGTDLSADATYAFSTDIDGDTRSAPWSIGADQFIATASGPHGMTGLSGLSGAGDLDTM